MLLSSVYTSYLSLSVASDAILERFQLLENILSVLRIVELTYAPLTFSVKGVLTHDYKYLRLEKKTFHSTPTTEKQSLRNNYRGSRREW